MKNNIKTIIVSLFSISAIVSSVFLWKNSGNDVLGIDNISKAQDETSKKTEEKINIVFLGDLMFDRYIREVSQKKGNDFIFEKLENILLGNDLVIANLEGPITDKKSVSIGTLPGEKGHMVFTFDPSLALTLKKNRINSVNIGNNHILNFGKTGLQQTADNLEKAGIGYFGDAGDENKYLIKEIGTTKIGFVNYNQFSSNPLGKTLENIRKIKDQTDILIVYTHWGTEYKKEPEDSIKKLARKFIDEGADLVIGTHPHVVQPMEEYKGKRIYYSLGNFIFDQYFSPETKKGLAVRAKIDPEDNSIDFMDIDLSLETSGQTSSR